MSLLGTLSGACNLYPPMYVEGALKVVYKRGGIYWYKFVWKGELIRASTRLSNRREAEQIEAAKRTALAKGEVGIKEKPPSPTLVEFAPRFTAAIETLCFVRGRRTVRAASPVPFDVTRQKV